MELSRPSQSPASEGWGHGRKWRTPPSFSLSGLCLAGSAELWVRQAREEGLVDPLP